MVYNYILKTVLHFNVYKLLYLSLVPLVNRLPSLPPDFYAHAEVSQVTCSYRSFVFLYSTCAFCELSSGNKTYIAWAGEVQFWIMIIVMFHFQTERIRFICRMSLSLFNFHHVGWQDVRWQLTPQKSVCVFTAKLRHILRNCDQFIGYFVT